MIMDNLAQWRRYAGISPRLSKAFAFLEKLDANQPTGRFEIDGDAVYCLVQRYRTKPQTQAVFEAHRKYADIQFLLAGRETILWAPLVALTTVTQPYAEPTDCALYAMVNRYTPLRMQAGQFAILFPADGHAPGVECEGAAEVVKAVVKVRVPEDERCV